MAEGTQFPMFDRTGDGYGWLILTEQFWNAQRTAENQRFLEIERGLNGKALTWFRLWKKCNPNADRTVFDIAFMHRYVPNSRPILPSEISWNEVSDLDVILEEIRAYLEKYQPQQLDLNLQDSGGEESDFNLEPQPQQQQQEESAKIQANEIQKQEFSNNNSEFSESTIIDLESSRSIDQDSRIVDNIHHIISKASTKNETQDQNRRFDDQSIVVTDLIAMAADKEDKKHVVEEPSSFSEAMPTVMAVEDDDDASSSAEVGASAEGKVVAMSEMTNSAPLDLSDNEDGGASAEIMKTVAVVNIGYDHSGRLHHSPRPRDQEYNGITGAMNDDSRRELRDQERDGFGGGGGSNHHRRALPLVARPPVLLAAAFPWMRESES